MSRLLFVTSGLWVLGACTTRDRLVDPGSACIGAVPNFIDEDPQIVIDGTDETSITLLVSGCSSGSTQYLRQTCEVVDAGENTLEISGFTVARTPASVTADCNVVTIECGSFDLADGDWTVLYGEGETTFTVPYAGPAICVES